MQRQITSIKLNEFYNDAQITIYIKNIIQNKYSIHLLLYVEKFAKEDMSIKKCIPQKI